MAVYYKFKSAKDYESIPMEAGFMLVGQFKQKVFEINHLGRGTDFDLIVSNAQTNEEYLNEGMLIPKNTSVLVRRVPGLPRRRIIIAPVIEQEESNVQSNSDGTQSGKCSSGGTEACATKNNEDDEWNDFGDDIYAIPGTTPVQSSILVQEASSVSEEDEKSKIKALIDTPALDWQCQPSDGIAVRGSVWGIGGRMTGKHNFDRGSFEKKIPPEGYICHRCKIPGHFIQHCPTNGDPSFDIKRMKPATGIPKNMLMANPDGSYTLPSGDVAVFKSNEAAFEKENESIPSTTHSVGDLPPELHCPLCKEVMKDAALTSKCCFTSFCDKCIRDYVISKSKCVCGATNILADDLLPNKTLRNTINRILESNSSSGENRSVRQAQDMESCCPQAKVRSPTESAAFKGQQVPEPAQQRDEEASSIQEIIEENKAVNVPQKQEEGTILKAPDVLEVMHDSKSVKETASRGIAQLANEEVPQKPVPGLAGKKKKEKKIHVPPVAVGLPWRAAQDLASKNYMMPLGPSAFNPCWNGVQPGLDGFMSLFPASMPFGGYGIGPMNPFGGVLPQDQFGGPILPYGPPHRELSKDREYGRKASSTVDVPPMTFRYDSVQPQVPLSAEHRRPDRRSSDRQSTDREIARPSSSSKKKSSEEYDHSHLRPEDRSPHRDHRDDGSHRKRSMSSAEPKDPSSAGDTKQKAGNISFPGEWDGGDSNKRKLSSSSSVLYDDERNFKRRRSSR